MKLFESIESGFFFFVGGKVVLFAGTYVHPSIHPPTHTHTFVLDRPHAPHAPAREPLVEVVEPGPDQPAQAADEEEEEELPHSVVDALVGEGVGRCVWVSELPSSVDEQHSQAQEACDVWVGGEGVCGP